MANCDQMKSSDQRGGERVAGKLVGDSVSMLKVIVFQTELLLSFISDLSSALQS